MHIYVMFKILLYHSNHIMVVVVVGIRRSGLRVKDMLIIVPYPS